MPPVFGPVSPSKTALWSCVGSSGTTFSPSPSAMKLTSSPAGILRSRRVPARRSRRSAASASAAAIVRDDDALARCQSVGLEHDGIAEIVQARRASSARSTTAKRAVGMPARSMNSLAKILLPSSCAAAARRANDRAYPRRGTHRRRRRPAALRGPRPSDRRRFPRRSRDSRRAVVGRDAVRQPRASRDFPERRRPVPRRALRETPGEGVLAAAASDDQYLH